MIGDKSNFEDPMIQEKIDDINDINRMIKRRTRFF
jgi:uncharacterized protein YfkK (UPF0435 family)